MITETYEVNVFTCDYCGLTASVKGPRSIIPNHWCKVKPRKGEEKHLCEPCSKLFSQILNLLCVKVRFEGRELSIFWDEVEE